MKKGINAWAKELKHNEGFAKKYEGVKTVEDILNVAKTQGYDISKKDLEELDLDAVAGGVGQKIRASLDLNFDINKAELNYTAVASGENATAVNQGNATVNM